MGERYAELAGFIARCRNDAARDRAADGHALAGQLGIVPLSDAVKEGIHIHVDDLALAGRFLGHRNGLGSG